MQVQLIYDDTERYFISRNLVKSNFWGTKKNEKAFHFPRCYFGMSIFTRAHRKPPRAASKIAKSCARESSVNCVWHSTCYNARHIVSRNNPAYSRIYSGCFYRRGTSTRGLTPVCLELRLRSQRGFIVLSSGFAKRWHSLLPPSWRYGIRQGPRPGTLRPTRILVALLAGVEPTSARSQTWINLYHSPARRGTAEWK